jgi:hypothetical protein
MKFEYFQKLDIFMKLKIWKLHIIKDSTFEYQSLNIIFESLKYMFKINF